MNQKRMQIELLNVGINSDIINYSDAKNYYNIDQSLKDMLCKKIEVTDFAILTGAEVVNGNSTNYLAKTNEGKLVKVVNDKTENENNRTYALRPVIKLTDKEFKHLLKQKSSIVKYGEYPQDICSYNEDLEIHYKNNYMKETGKVYITDSRSLKEEDKALSPRMNYEYTHESEQKKFVRMLYPNIYNEETILSNNESCNKNKVYWLQVLPIKWYLDKVNKTIISEKALISGIRCEQKDINNFLNNYLLNEVTENKKSLKKILFK